MPASELKLSVIVPTRNRPGHLVDCLRTILPNDGIDQLFVVDQSDDDRSERFVVGLGDPRVQHIRTTTRGVTKARNIGMDAAKCDIVVFTDDDCRVPGDWIVKIRAVFADDPEAAIVCGRVRVSDELRRRGFAESFEPRQRAWQGSYPPPGQWGITANLSLRRSVVMRIGPFDPLLGAGAPLRSGGEPDLLFRALKAGMRVVNAHEVVVDHVGVRAPGVESTNLIRRYGAGTAAAFFKHVRLGDRAAAGIYGNLLSATAQRVFGNFIHRRRPSGAGFLLALLSGAIDSYRFDVDPASCQYVERGGVESGAPPERERPGGRLNANNR